MATNEGLPAVTPGRSGKQIWSLVGQYAALCALSLLVLGPLYLTVIQALSPPFEYANAGRPLHPVNVDWQDRTWFTGGLLSIVVRTLIVGLLLSWLQKAASGRSYRPLGTFFTPARLVAVIGGTVAVALVMGPVYQSLATADGATAAKVAVAMAVVALTQVWGFASPQRPAWITGVMAVLTGVGLVAFCVIAFGPVVWTSSWSRYSLGPAMGRSFVMATLITAFQVVTAIMSAYAFVFLRFPFKRLAFALYMGTLLLPIEVTLVGNLASIRQLEWTDTMQALVLPFAGAALGTFLIRQGFRGLPSEIQDATKLDGYGHVAFMTKFAVPLTRPVIASFTVIAALGAWNQYTWPRAVTESNSFNTLQIQLRLAASSTPAEANTSIAAALVAAVPVVLLLIAFQRQIIRGLTAGAVK